MAAKFTWNKHYFANWILLNPFFQIFFFDAPQNRKLLKVFTKGIKKKHCKRKINWICGKLFKVIKKDTGIITEKVALVFLYYVK